MSNYAYQIRTQQEAGRQLRLNNIDLRNWITNLNGERRKLYTRLREVNDIKTNVESRLTGSADNVASAQRDTANKLHEAVVMKGFTDDIVSEITRSIEPALYNDDAGSSMIGYLRSEIQRIEGEIQNIDSNVNSANRRIDQNNQSLATVNRNIDMLRRAQAREQSNG